MLFILDYLINTIKLVIVRFVFLKTSAYLCIMKFLLLDHDGPMVTDKYSDQRDNKWGKPRFDKQCVAILNHILHTSDCEIICISDWRNNLTLAEMKELYTSFGVIKSPIGYTPSSKNYTGMNLEGGRAEEIKMWVAMYAWKDDSKWVAVDDMNMDQFLFPNFVHCPSHTEGIKQVGIKEQILKKLM